MNSLENLVVVVQVISALAIIGLVLLQHGKGADMGASFGSGASGSLFGATGSSNFMSKSTGVAAAIFFTSTLILANYATNRNSEGSAGVMERAATPGSLPVAPAAGAIPQAPVAPAPAPAAAPAAAPATGSAAPAAAAPATAPAPAPAAPAGPGQIPK